MHHNFHGDAGKFNGKVFKRLLKVIFSSHRGSLVLAILGVIVSSFAMVAGSVFLERLIDDYIVPLTKSAHPDYGPLANALLIMAAIYYTGVLGTTLYSEIMSVVGQGVQLRIREQMFAHMQTLPVSYFDQNDYGDIMSRYTNDVDTLMQMITQSLPQMLNSLMNITFVTIAMLVISWQLTLLSFVIFALSIFIVRFLSRRSAYYFKAQQQTLGDVDAYIEEMLNGQKVVKVFSHEKAAEKQFDVYNNDLETDAARANGFATMLFPIMGNVGNLLYVLTAFVGGALSVSHTLPLTLGAIAAFLQLSRSFTQPISQISQQLNSIIMALAGAQRIFELLDEQPEIDAGDIDLVQVSDQNGQLVPDDQGQLWAWVKPEADNQASYRQLKGHVQFDDVDFSYDGKHTVLYDVSLDAEPGQKMAFVGATGAGKTTITAC
ncbi:multidrug ABC transporter ATPase [Lactobacillus selangorensis]|uniref:Multidrug ABC transporter ATPase n=1 Tax=Lactobacillus selangorensis TaxID=81857 RepID=A0A0R2FTC6_9LACO|nr:multidrug ABC transporter ATPase [Lactobacillus selangorensis]KRN32879.1 multidrug ABC transporter ATPase [Lactobacillus selangorensis]